MAKYPDDNPAIPRRGGAIRGEFYTRAGKSGTVVAKWPRKAGPPVSAAQAESRELIRYASIICNYVDPYLMAMAREIADHTQLLPRDFAIIVLFGRAFTYIAPDGRWIYSMASMQDISRMIDAIGQVEGMILFRGETWWQGLPIGNEDDVLKVGPDGVPEWGIAPLGGTVNVLETTDIAGTSLPSFDFNAYLANYSALEIQLQNCQPTSDGAVLQLQLGTGSPPTYKTGSGDYRFAFGRWFSSPGVNNGGTTSSLVQLNSGNGCGNGAAEGMDVTIRTLNWSRSGVKSRYTWDASVYTDNDLATRFAGAFHLNDANPATGMRIAWTAGNFAQGVVKVIGYL